MTFSNATPLLVSLLLMLLIMAMIGVEDVGKLSGFVFGMDGFDKRLLKLRTGELTLQLLNFLAGLVVEGMKHLLFQPTLPRPRTLNLSVRHCWTVHVPIALGGMRQQQQQQMRLGQEAEDEAMQ
jgi:hypothetical protein